MSNLLISLAIVFYFGFFTQQLNLSWLHDHFLPITFATTGLAFALSLMLYISSFRRGCRLAHGGNSGIPVYDFFMGRCAHSWPYHWQACRRPCRGEQTLVHVAASTPVHVVCCQPPSSTAEVNLSVLHKSAARH